MDIERMFERILGLLVDMYSPARQFIKSGNRRPTTLATKEK
jgi:hypothetical protein